MEFQAGLNENGKELLHDKGLMTSWNLTIYNIIHWLAATNDLSTKRLMFQVLFFFHDFLQNSLQKWFQCIFYFFLWIFTKKPKSFEYPKSIRDYEKNNAWNIRCLVDKNSAPAWLPDDFPTTTKGSKHLITINLFLYYTLHIPWNSTICKYCLL